MDPNQMRSADFKVGAILNTSSGSCDEVSATHMLGILKEAGIVGPRMWCGGGDQMEDSFKEALSLDLDLLIVLGGDGTIRTAAEACGQEKPYLIPLPGGTMNVLPHALYGDRSWEDALRATLAAPAPKTLSGGEANKRQFFIAAVVGAPSLWADAREAVRGGDITAAVEKGGEALQNMFAINVQYQLAEGPSGDAESIVSICPFISEELANTEQALEVAVVDIKNAAHVIGLATYAAFGKWRDDSHVLLTKSKKLTITSTKDIPSILDGERVNLGRRAEIKFLSRAFTALVPAK